jgi:hypothetical protein
MTEPVMHESFWSLRFSDIINIVILIVTIFAIYYGPIRAVEVARQNDVVREAVRRQREIFAALMRTRNATLMPEHVWALNLIQVEFARSDSIIDAYKGYIAHLGRVAPTPGPALDPFIRERRDLFFDLLHEIATVVGFSLDKRDLERAAYVPAGWEYEQAEQQALQRAMLELLDGRRGLPVAPFLAHGTQSPFPPPPGQTVPAASPDP